MVARLRGLNIQPGDVGVSDEVGVCNKRLSDVKQAALFRVDFAPPLEILVAVACEGFYASFQLFVFCGQTCDFAF